MFPVFDVGNIPTWIMRGLQIALKISFILFIFKTVKAVFNFLIKPLGLFAIVAIIQWNPTILRNLLYYIGYWTIETSIGFYKIFYNTLMSSENLSSIQKTNEVNEIFELAKSGLPSEWVQLIQTLDVIPLIGIIISTILYCVVIRIIYTALYKQDFTPKII